MNSPSEPSPPSPDERSPNGNADGSPTTAASEFQRSLQEVERSLDTLKVRYAQIQRDRHRQQELQHRREDVRQQLRQNRGSDPSRLPQLKEELRQIQAQLETIELNLESELFSFGSLKEPFWQAVRFGGLGIVVGWILKSCAG